MGTEESMGDYIFSTFDELELITTTFHKVENSKEPAALVYNSMIDACDDAAVCMAYLVELLKKEGLWPYDDEKTSHYLQVL